MRTTGLFIVGLLLLILAYDLWALLTGRAATFSQWFHELGHENPIIPWLVGLMMGATAAHFWWGKIAK